MKFVVLLVLLFVEFDLCAQSSMIVEGTIIRKSHHVVTLRERNGAMIRVPEAVLRSHKEIRPGHDFVRVEVRPHEFLKLNPKILKTKK